MKRNLTIIEKRHLHTTVLITAISLVIILLMICLIMWFNRNEFYIDQEISIDNYNIIAIHETFEPFIKEFSIKVNKEFFLQKIVIVPNLNITATYENDDGYSQGNVIIIELVATKENDSWVIKKITRLRDPKLIKLSLPGLKTNKWKYDVNYFLEISGYNISQVHMICAELGKVKIGGDGVLIVADPITGHVFSSEM